MLLKGVYEIIGIGIVIVGTVKSGTIKVSMRTNIGGKVMEIKSMEQHHKQISEAGVGEPVGINLRNADEKSLQIHMNREIEFY